MKEQIIFVSTNSFRTNRLLPAIEVLSKDYEIVCLSLGNGNIMLDLRSLYHLQLRSVFQRYLKLGIFNELIANEIRLGEKNIPYWYEGDIERVVEDLDLSRVRCVIYDDSRTAGHQIPKIIFEPWYNRLKSLGIPVIANAHGNVDDHRFLKFMTLERKKIYDELFLYGKYDKSRTHNAIRSHMHEVGIPENDLIKDRLGASKKSHVLVVLNRVNCKALKMDKSIIDNLQIQELWEKYRVPIIFKVKEPPPSGTEHASSEKQAIEKLLHDYYNRNRNNLSKEIGIIITEDEYQENMLLLDACCVISYGSTMCFKPIQADVPTIIIKEMGNVANFSDYHATISIEEDIIAKIDEWDLKLSERRRFLDNTLAGSLDYSSTAKYVQTVKRIIDDYKEKNTNQ
tara:strand:- start:811 stop:2004 length:1194 start_codon:yes stop_codon:yes gene_type:complete